MSTPTQSRTRLATGLAAGTHVMTLKGRVAVETLKAGDRIVTRNGMRQLRGVTAHERYDAEVVHIRASALGHARPEEDITLAADQPVLIRDWRARALFKVDTAAVPATRLADGEYIVRETVPTLRCYTLVFDAPEIVYAEGCELLMAEPARV